MSAAFRIDPAQTAVSTWIVSWHQRELSTVANSQHGVTGADALIVG
jgi:hypothetical protein